jgi:hypothetical protein
MIGKETLWNVTYRQNLRYMYYVIHACTFYIKAECLEMENKNDVDYKFANFWFKSTMNLLVAP